MSTDVEMQFAYGCDPRLPRLAWCARMDRGDPRVGVEHGPWVETRPRFFVEGAWDGAWAEGRFDRAVTFAGSGARLDTAAVRFCAPSHNLERLYAVHLGDTLYVSNALPFVMVRAGVELDMAYPDYFFDLLDFYRQGIRRNPHRHLRTASGPPVELIDAAIIEVTSNLDVRRVQRDFGAAPASYQDYVHRMEATVVDVIRNAADPERCRPFPPLTSISRGYDSTAVSVWAVRAGCRNVVTFHRSGDLTTKEKVYAPDDGTEIAGILGLEVTAYERRDMRTVGGPGPAELFQNPFFTTDVATQVMEDQVQGTLWLSGRHGEQFWNLDPRASWPWYEDPVSMSMAGASTTDMRLRIGYLNFPVPYTLGVHAPALNRIGRSEALAPWRIGGDYDRSIPRRVLEDAGVPRHLFGQVKMGGNGDAPELRRLAEDDEASFQAFYRERVPTRVQEALVPDQLGPTPFYVAGKMAPVERWLRTRRPLAGVAPRVLGNRRHHRWRSSYLYAFHWGFQRTSERYRVPPPDTGRA